MELRARLFVFRADLLLRAANRRRRRQLGAELAAYVSHAELNDLHALLDTYSDGQTHEIREILDRQQAGRLWTARLRG
ncbi:hypothetical protein [Actinoplanes subtropicus]|uniref:hypothetical protein n=1 Tax=Actinoplanes subtropicus TaxID=543632 RepID=UPI0012F93496|nr:hypothetical protein [Actinoplanes subtropicus]